MVAGSWRGSSLFEAKDLSEKLRAARGEPAGTGAEPAPAKSSEQRAVPDAAFAREIESVLRAEHADPFHILGPHTIEPGDEKFVAIRTCLPGANEVSVVFADGRASCLAKKIHPDGFFEAILPAAGAVPSTPTSYRLRVRYADGSTHEIYDPYAF